MNSAIKYLFQEDLYYFTTPVIVAVPTPWESYTPDEQKLLQKILTSVKIDISTIQLVVQPSFSLTSLLVYSPARVLIFGCKIQEDITAYQETPALGFMAIWADDIRQLDDQKKKNLWVALRQMFSPYP